MFLLKTTNKGLTKSLFFSVDVCCAMLVTGDEQTYFTVDSIGNNQIQYPSSIGARRRLGHDHATNTTYQVC